MEADRAARRRLLERRPAAVFFVAAGPDLTGITQQPLTYVLSDGVRTKEPDCAHRLDFNGPLAATARNPKHVALYLGQPPLAGLGAVGGSSRVGKHRLPIFGRERLQRVSRRLSRHTRRFPGGSACQLLHLASGSAYANLRVDRSFRH